MNNSENQPKFESLSYSPDAHRENFQTLPCTSDLILQPNIDRSEVSVDINADSRILEAREIINSIYPEQETTALPVEPVVETQEENSFYSSLTEPNISNEKHRILTRFSPHNIHSIVKKVMSRNPLKIRAATFEDIDQLVEVDLKTFKSVYRGYNVDPDQWENELKVKFVKRLEKTGGDWCQVLERDNRILGFIMSTPTSKQPEDFVSWEETTDNGTLETTYDSNGGNVYVVSLSVLPEAAKDYGQKMLMANAIGKGVEGGYKQGYFESRLPGLLHWVRKQCRVQGREFNNLTDTEKDVFANQYFQLKTIVDGKEVYFDKLIRIYAEAGCKFIKVVPNAYQDALSMNYGVMCIWANPEFLQKHRALGRIVGKSLRQLSHSSYIMDKFF